MIFTSNAFHFRLTVLAAAIGITVVSFAANASEPVLLELQAENDSLKISATGIAKAEPVQDPNTVVPQISIELSKERAKQFSEMTSQNIGKRIAVKLCGKLMIEPVVREPIYGGQLLISGFESLNAVKTLSKHISNGTCP